MISRVFWPGIFKIFWPIVSGGGHSIFPALLLYAIKPFSVIYGRYFRPHNIFQSKNVIWLFIKLNWADISTLQEVKYTQRQNEILWIRATLLLGKIRAKLNFIHKVKEINNYFPTIFSTFFDEKSGCSCETREKICISTFQVHIVHNFLYTDLFQEI